MKQIWSGHFRCISFAIEIQNIQILNHFDMSSLHTNTHAQLHISNIENQINFTILIACFCFVLVPLPPPPLLSLNQVLKEMVVFDMSRLQHKL